MRFLKLFGREAKTLTELELLETYRRTGEVRLAGELYQPYMPMVFSLCYKYLRDDDESKDAVMNIFEKLVEDLRMYEVDHFKSWLQSVTRNYCLMQIRAKRVFVDLDGPGRENEGVFEVSASNDDTALQLDGDLTTLEKCMDALVEQQRTSLRLFFMEEKCYREIADETGFDFNKVKSYIQNGKRNLKICIEKNGERENR